MGRKLRFDTRKNHERRKALIATPTDLVIRLPTATSYLPSLVSTMSELHRRLTSLKDVPSGWTISLVSGSSESSLALVKLTALQPQKPKVLYMVTISEDFTWVARRGERVVPKECEAFNGLSDLLQSVQAVTSVLSILDHCKPCIGNPDDMFCELAARRDGKFLDRSGSEVMAYYDNDISHPTIRHKACDIVIPLSDAHDRCSSCSAYRKTLHVLSKRLHSRVKPGASSHINYKYRSTTELVDCLHEMRSQKKIAQLQVSRLQEKLVSVIASQGVDLDEGTSKDLADVMKDADDRVKKQYPPDSFQAIFWKQQAEASQRSPKGMRWHPLMIKWCIYLRHLSSKAYETLRDSGCIHLPSQRTLRDYTNCVKASAGFSHEVDKQLMQAADVEACPKWQKLVILLLDEMYIREGLVYNKHTGQLVGFADLGDVNNHLLAFERMVKGEKKIVPPLAKTMMVFMVRGLFTPLRFAYAQFPCENVTGGLLFQPFWEAIYRLERMTLKVLAVTCDGASVNRRLLSLHKSEDMHKVHNVHAIDERDIYFFSDPPHLIKTTRNCWASTYRKLWNNGHEISWRHLVDLYERDAGKGSGLAMLPKLKLEHLQLTSFSKMRVDLAAQVLSETVSNALMLTGGEEAVETSRFVSLIDKFFDMLNVGDFTTGMKQRKRFKYPYRHTEDWRLDWLKDVFLPYFDHWEASVHAREGFKVSEKERMLISSETRLGLRITAMSFIGLVKLMFSLPEVKGEKLAFLSISICQDPLENFFGCQRQRGGTSENPNVAEFSQNTQALRVMNGLCRGPVQGNCRGASKRQKEKLVDESIIRQAIKPIPRKIKKTE